MASRQEYIAIKRDLFRRLAQAKKMKIELLTCYLSATYPDITFEIISKEGDKSNLNVTIQFRDLDAAETNAMSDAVNRYLANLDAEARNVS